MSLLKKSWLLLDYKQKKYAIFIFILMFFAMILETLSVGIVVPLLSIFLKGDIESSIFSYFFIFGKPTGKNLIYVGLLTTSAIFLLKNFLLAFNLWHQSKFLQQTKLEFTNKLFKYYLKNDYMFFLQNNSASLYRNLTDIIATFVQYITKHMIFFSEIIVFTGITFVLFYVDFLGTIIVLFSVSIVTSIIYILTRKRVISLGKERVVIGGELNKHLFQGMAAAKDVKILDREEDLIYQVDKNLSKMSKLNYIIEFIRGLPRLSFEVLIVCVFLAITLLMLSLKREMVDIVLYLGVFAAASFRIIPSASKLLDSVQLIKHVEPGVRIFLEEFDSNSNSYIERNYKQKNLDLDLKFQKEISVTDLSFSYPIRKEFSLSKVSMTIKKGDFVGIVGETGSGKSTLINLLIGLLRPSEGKIEIDKLNINSNLPAWYKKIGYVPQSIYLIDDSIKKNIAFGLREDNIDDNLIKKAIEKASLDKFINSLTDGLETIVGEKGIRLSGGQQQRIGIARALYRDPEILILDEATSSLDQITEEKIMKSIQFLIRKKTLIIITHRLFTVKNCDKIFFIDKGKIIKQGSPEKVLNNI